MKGFVSEVFNRFRDNHCNALAAELTLNSLLALVPFMAVTLSLLAIFPAFENVGGQIQDIIFRNFLPDTGIVVQQHLEEFVQKSRSVMTTSIGIAVLIVTALLLMRAVDKAFEIIWKSHFKRTLIGKFLVYWSLLTLTPILMGASIGVTSYLGSLPFVQQVVTQISGVVKIGLPFLLAFVAFLLMYLILPTRRVRLVHGTIGALVATVLFELAKYGFAVFVSKFSTYDLIYGAVLATLPLFVIWIYLSWLIILLGAEISHSLEDYRPNTHHARNPFVLALRIVEQLAKAQARGETLTFIEIEQAFPETNEQDVRLSLNRLQELDIVGGLLDSTYCLKVNGREFTLANFYQRINLRLPGQDEAKSLCEEVPELAEALLDADRALQEQLSDPFLK